MLTYSYIDKNTGNEITNIYNGYAASAIRDTMKKFTPSSQKKIISKKCKNYTASVNVDMRPNPYQIDNDVYKAAFQLTR